MVCLFKYFGYFKYLNLNYLITGRCARAGRSGTAYSLVGPDEYAHLLDLHLFLGKPLSIVTASNADGVIGRIPQSLVEEQHEMLLGLHEVHLDLVIILSLFLFKYCSNLLF